MNTARASCKGSTGRGASQERTQGPFPSPGPHLRPFVAPGSLGETRGPPRAARPPHPSPAPGEGPESGWGRKPGAGSKAEGAGDGMR